MYDFSKTLIRCSSLGALFTEPQSKADKEAGNLSKTAKTHLKSIYIREKYGREKDIVTRQMQKGIEVEGQSITLLSMIMGKMLIKNEDRLNNSFITGLPDLFDGETIETSESLIDIKSSYDLFTFMSNVNEPLNTDYYAQLQGYMWLSDISVGYIAYCLVNSPDWLLEGEKFRLLRAMDVISEESPEFKIEEMKLEKMHKFDDIAPEERVLLFPVLRDEEFIEKIQQKVGRAREYLQELEKNHCNFNKEVLNLQ